MQPGKAFSIPSEDRINSSEDKLIPIPWLRRIFGCKHKKMANPFTRDNKTYSTCLDCGARRYFDTDKWKLTGPFYYVAPSSLYDND